MIVLVARAVLVHLRLSGVEQGQQPGVVGVVGVVDDGVHQVGGGQGRAVGKVCRVTLVDGGGVRAILQAVAAKDEGRCRDDPGVAQQKVAAGVGGVAVQVEGVVGDVAVAVVQDEYQAVEGGVAVAAVVQLDELEHVGAGCVGVQFVDDYVGNRSAAERLPDVGSAKGVGDRAGPRKVLVDASLTRQLQGLADEGAGTLGDSDVGAGHTVGDAVGGGEGAFVAEELHHDAAVVDQGDAVGRTVLDAVDGVRDVDDTKAVLLVGDDAAQGGGVVGSAAIAVVQDDAPTGQVCSCRACDLYRLSRVGVGVVVVDLVDENAAAGLGHRSRQASKEEQRQQDGDDQGGRHWADFTRVHSFSPWNCNARLLLWIRSLASTERARRGWGQSRIRRGRSQLYLQCCSFNVGVARKGVRSLTQISSPPYIGVRTQQKDWSVNQVGSIFVLLR